MLLHLRASSQDSLKELSQSSRNATLEVSASTYSSAGRSKSFPALRSQTSTMSLQSCLSWKKSTSKSDTDMELGPMTTFPTRSGSSALFNQSFRVKSRLATFRNWRETAKKKTFWRSVTTWHGAMSSFSCWNPTFGTEARMKSNPALGGTASSMKRFIRSGLQKSSTRKRQLSKTACPQGLASGPKPLKPETVPSTSAKLGTPQIEELRKLQVLQDLSRPRWFQMGEWRQAHRHPSLRLTQDRTSSLLPFLSWNRRFKSARLKTWKTNSR